MASLSKEEKLKLITANLAEVLDLKIIEDVLAEGRNPKIYWGTAPTGRPHCGYFVAAIKIAELLAAGCEVTVLLADIHATLDSQKSPDHLVEHRVAFYQLEIIAMLESLGVSTTRLKFVPGSSFQNRPEYTMDFRKLSSLVSAHDARKAGAEVVKQSDNASLGSLNYPLLQALDLQYLGVDAQLGGMDQRKLFTAENEWLPKLGYRQRAHLINPLIPGLGQGGKMSSSDEDSKIDILDPPEVMARKIRKAVAAPRLTDGNGLLAFAELVLIPVAALKGNIGFIIDRSRDALQPLVYTNAEQMRVDYPKDILTPQLLKAAVVDALNNLLAPIQAEYQASKEWREVTLKAYPHVQIQKKVKKVKNKGTGHPGRKDSALAGQSRDDQVG